MNDKQRRSILSKARSLARILIIEDNPANMELMAYLLKAHGHVPLHAHDGREGIARACGETPDAIICDVHLPKLDGYGVISFLKSHPSLRAVPTVAVTALAMVGDREKLLASGFDGYISKPIDPVAFVPLIESFVLRAHSPHARTAEAETYLPYRRRSEDGDDSDR